MIIAQSDAVADMTRSNDKLNQIPGNAVHYTIKMHPYGYRQLMRFCTLHNGYAPVLLPETDEITHPAQLLCTRMATGR